MQKTYDIFISYRRDGGFATANHIYRLLTQDGYSVSFDVDTIREGDFNVNLLNRIEQCTDFLLIVDKHCFDRTLEKTTNSKQDWLRIELAHALKLNKNIVPILLTGVKEFPQNLPSDINDVATKNGPEYNQSYFEEFYKKLKLFLHSKPKNISRNELKKNLIKKAMYVGFALIAVIIGYIAILNKPWVIDNAKDTVVSFVADSTCINPIMGQYTYTGPIDSVGRPHGKGLAKFPQGDTYDGFFSHGDFDGKCIYFNAETGDRFEGTYRNNKRYEGTYVWSEGPYFTGYFKDNNLFKGTLYDVTGEIIKEY